MTNEAGFQLTGSAPERYERFNMPIMAPFVAALIDAAGLRPGSAVVDLACGTGFAARAAAARVGVAGRVVGVDANPGMLAMAAAAADAVVPTIEWCQAGAGAVPLPDAAFDAVVCQQGMQFFADLPAAVVDAARLLRPQGVLAATVWAPMARSPFFRAQGAAVDALLASNERGSFAAAFGCTALRLSGAFDAAGLVDVEHEEVEAMIRIERIVEFVPAQLSALPWGAALNAARPDGIAEASRIIVDELHDLIDADGSMTAPFVSSLVSARQAD